MSLDAYLGAQPRTAYDSRIQVPAGGPTRHSLARSVHSGYGIDHLASAARLQTLAGAFEKGIGVIREHALDYFQTMMVPANSHRLVKLINSDLTGARNYFGRA